MVHYSEKRIKNGKYLYAMQSIRLPDGRIAKLSKRVSSKSEPGIEAFFEQKQAELLANFAENKLKPFKLRDPAALEKIEIARIEYRKILKRLSKNQLKDLFDRFTVNFTYESNALEGNSLTLKDVAIVLFENAAVKGKPLREIYETRNSRNIVELILKNKFKATEKDALKMHEILVKDMQIPSGYKTVPNYLYGREVVTVPPEEVPAEMKRLFEWFSQNKGKMHPLQLAARLHGKFERIHPFEDGNGRVGRFLSNVVLVNAGYPPLIVRTTQRIAYFNALHDFDEGRAQMIEKFFYDRFIETNEKFFKIYAKYLK